VSASIPDWLMDAGLSAFGEDWDTELRAMNTPAPVILRCNRLKTNLQELQQGLQKAGIDCVAFDPAVPDALLLTKRANVFTSELFKNGWFEVQDAASQLVVEHLQVKPGLRVIDACAGAGGKTLQLAALMQKKGQIIALDTEQYKLDELKKRAKRAGADNIESRLIESTKTIKRLHDSADRLLLDVPCSGLGVLRRNPDAKWKLKPEFIQTILGVQREILQNYSKMLKKGGLMVYATCSILPDENERQVQYFLANHPEFTLLAERKTTPARDQMDGFYMATLKRND
jgi:16S rRNA (cytosine967-C5)-methyltransferase